MASVATEDDGEPAEDHREPSLGTQIESVCHDVNSALATVILCVEFLAERSADADDAAIQDARVAVRHIVGQMATLRKIAALARDAHAGAIEAQQKGSLRAVCRRGGS